MLLSNPLLKKHMLCLPSISTVNIVMNEEDDNVNEIISPRRIFLIIYILSFIPYFLPSNLRPSFYKDGKTYEEINEEKKKKELKRFIGGDIDGIFD
tara:strand:- start:253 stop:540 length:288 start_codon:yes stop_codon:yes gene_type:complete